MFFTTPDKEMRAAARGWLDLADKILNYRRDQLAAAQLGDLQKKTETLRAQVRDKADAAKLKLSIEALEPVLRQTGGKHYPRSGMLEWVEFLVVAAIVLLAVRQFFFQPFQIPTNSMWPSYNGMVPEVHATPVDEPGTAAKIFRGVAFGASTYRVDAEADGEILIALNGGRLLATPSKGRQWLVFPQRQQRFYLVVGGKTVSVSVPADFGSSMDWVLKDAFGSKANGFSSKKERVTLKDEDGRDDRIVETYVLHTGKYVKAGERVLSFDIISGDRLFVDRLSYHFVRPSIGSGFVFRTTNIPDTVDENKNHIESYYIKRLVGLPGDTLQVRPPVLYRNGAPITGAQAFADNNNRAGKYRGYTNPNFSADPRYGAKYLTSPDKTYTVSPSGYWAMGDNSNNSADSRYWGEVPKKDVTGRPLWVFYPFGSHWGPPR